MLEALRSEAEGAVRLALASGAEAAWASVDRSREVSTEWRDGAVEKVQEATSKSLTVRLFAGGRYSSHATTDLRPDRLEAFLREAVALTAALQEDPLRSLAEPERYVRDEPPLDQVDPKIAAIDADRRLAWCQELEAAARTHEAVLSASSSVSTTHQLSAAASSNGFSGTQESTSAWLSASVTLKDEGKRPEGSHFGGAMHLGDLPDRAQVGQRALERAVAKLGARKGPTVRTTMVVEPEVAGSILRRLLSGTDAASLQQGRSHWQGKLNTRVVSPKLTIVDNPHLPRGFASRHFDGEGLASRPMPLIESGVLKNYYVDTYYGRKLKMEPTNGGPSNLIVSLGSAGLEALLSDLQDAVLVEGWLGGNSDPTTGDFSLGCRGRRIVKGQRAEPIAEMNVTGNLVELFKGLVALGDDPYPYSSLRAPTLVFEGVQFSGA